MRSHTTLDRGNGLWTGAFVAVRMMPDDNLTGMRITPDAGGCDGPPLRVLTQDQVALVEIQYRDSAIYGPKVDPYRPVYNHDILSIGYLGAVSRASRLSSRL